METFAYMFGNFSLWLGALLAVSGLVVNIYVISKGASGRPWNASEIGNIIATVLFANLMLTLGGMIAYHSFRLVFK